MNENQLKYTLSSFVNAVQVLELDLFTLGFMQKIL